MFQRLSQLFLSPPSRCNRNVQLLSDLHLELNRQYATFTFPATAPLLVLGGDIGRLVDYEGYLGFLARQTSRYERVFLVLGNHEFYTLSYEQGIEQAQKLEAEDVLEGKLTVLHRARWDDEEAGLTILGCTLWSHVPDNEAEVVRLRVSDFSHITDWSVAKHNAVHGQDSAWLRDALQDVPPGRTILVATHHAPVKKGTSRPEHEKNPWKSAFSTDIMCGSEFRRLACWMFGHTHFCTDFVRGATRVVANQRGYVLGADGPALEKETKRGFDASKVVEL